MTYFEFVSQLDAVYPDEQRICPPVDAAEEHEWCSRFPNHLLPRDLLALYRQANGIQLWVCDGSPEGYYQLLPLRDVGFAREAMWGEYSGDIEPDAIPPPHWLAISEHQDGATYIVLDPDLGRYYLLDSCGADLTWPIGSTVSDLLHFIWHEWVIGMAAGRAPA